MVIQEDYHANFQTLRTLVFRDTRSLVDLGQDYFKVDMVVGASLIIRRELFKKLNGFDQRIFMFMEDDDLCLRATKAGYGVAIYTKASLVHLQGKSISDNRKRKALYYASQDYFWRKHRGIIRYSLMRALRFIYLSLKRQSS
jgi:GT2 family glycosyltransferase